MGMVSHTGTMKKLVLTFLLVLMPLQFAQAAMCPYCCSEGLPLSTQPDADGGPDVLGADDQPGQVNLNLSHRCGFCNLAQAKFIEQPLPVLATTASPPPYLADIPVYQSYIPHGLDRPNWTFFA